ncbi:MAG: hypothetical protein ABJB12_18345, partial [Pseudomonadota bacterium]
IAGTVCLLSLFAAGAAHAEESPTAGHASVAGLLGYGFKDGLNLGLGVRGGYTLPMNLYLGGTFVYHLGKSDGPNKVNLYYFGVEGGYDIAAGPVIVRPYLGLGDATASTTVDLSAFGGGKQSVSSSEFALWPGATVLYPLGNAFVGGDARFLIVKDVNAFSLFATGGIQF